MALDDGGWELFFQVPEQFHKGEPLEGCAVVNGLAGRIYAADVADIDEGGIAAFHAIAFDGDIEQLDNFSVGFDDEVIAGILPFPDIAPIVFDALNGSFLGSSAAMDNQVGDGSHESGL